MCDCWFCSFLAELINMLLNIYIWYVSLVSVGFKGFLSVVVRVIIVLPSKPNVCFLSFTPETHVADRVLILYLHGWVLSAVFAALSLISSHQSLRGRQTAWWRLKVTVDFHLSRKRRRESRMMNRWVSVMTEVKDDGERRGPTPPLALSAGWRMEQGMMGSFPRQRATAREEKWALSRETPPPSSLSNFSSSARLQKHRSLLWNRNKSSFFKAAGRRNRKTLQFNLLVVLLLWWWLSISTWC